jgi:O-antigen ligase
MNKIYTIFNNIIIFFFIFSFFNDNFLVEKINNNLLKILFILFLITNIKNIFKNLSKMTLFQDKIFFSFITLLLSLFLLQNILNTSDEITKYIFIFISFISIIIFFNIYNLERTLYFIWVSIFASVIICFFNEPISEFTFRTTGGTGDPNEFAAHLLVYFCISIYLFNKNRYKVFIFISIISFIYGILMAGSKSAFLVLMILLFISFVIKIKYFLNIKNIFLISSLFFILISTVDFNKIQMINNIIERSKSTGTAEERYKSWAAGKKMIESNPILGIGFGEYTNNTVKYSDSFVSTSSTAPHNLYIKLVAENGIPIFILFLFFIFVIIKNIFYYSNTNYLWIYMSLLSLLLMGITIGITYEKYFILIIAIVMNTNCLIIKKEQI